MSVSSAPTPYWSTTRDHISVQYTSQSSTTKLIDLGAKVLCIHSVGGVARFVFSVLLGFFFWGGGEKGELWIVFFVIGAIKIETSYLLQN